MPHSAFRNRLKAIIEFAIQTAADSVALEHGGLAGEVRESEVTALMGPLLRTGMLLGTGKLADASGATSKQIDAVVYDARILPPVFWNARMGVFPIESCLLVAEVKTVLSKRKLREAVKCLRSTAALAPHRSTALDSNALRYAGRTPWPRALFAFDSDLAAKGRKTELDRLRENVPNADGQPPFDRLCVVGRGYWKYNPQSDDPWLHFEANNERDEVIDFLTDISDDLQIVANSRGRPTLARYFSSSRRGTPA